MAQTTPTRELLVAQEAMRLRRGLLGGHHYAASRHDLEDIYSQAVLEVLLRARRDPTLSTPASGVTRMERTSRWGVGSPVRARTGDMCRSLRTRRTLRVAALHQARHPRV